MDFHKPDGCSPNVLLLECNGMVLLGELLLSAESRKGYSPLPKLHRCLKMFSREAEKPFGISIQTWGLLLGEREVWERKFSCASGHPVNPCGCRPRIVRVPIGE